LILPPSANTFVPLEPSVPIEAYHSEPLRIIGAMFAYVSTLLRIVGFQIPCNSHSGGDDCCPAYKKDAGFVFQGIVQRSVTGNDKQADE